jgi:RNA polymerase sigma-70 factor, ECF subfamily
VTTSNDDGEPNAADHDDFDAFYARCRDRLVGQLAALTGDAAEAHDHVQEAFIRAWLRWRRVGTLDDPEGWVRRVAYHLAISRWRRARRLVFGGRPDEPAPELDDEQRAVLDALAGLPRNEREAIVMHHLVGMSVDEVAAALKAPSGTVKSWLSRGRAKLGATLVAESVDE